MNIAEFDLTVKKIPEGIDSNELQKIFELFLKLDFNNKELLEMYYLLFELSSKQWHTYSIMGSCLKKDINSWIITNMSDSYEFYELVLGICANIGLNKLYREILESDQLKKLYPELKNEFIRDVGNNVHDPYIALRGF